MITPFHENLNSAVLDLIPINASKVVDVGCMNGVLAREFRKINPAVHWTGIEINKNYAELATRHCDNVLNVDIEENNPEFFLKFKDVDCWIFSDVLEHLYNPWKVIENIRRIIPERGCIVACIPNAQNWQVLSKLASGNFDYEESGLMDKSHIRWFTKKTFFEFFENTSFRIVEGRYVYDKIPKTETLEIVKSLSKLYYDNNDVTDVDITAIQYVIRAVPNFN